MRSPVDDCLATEAARFALRFACDDCVHFSPERERTCGHGWPIRLHRSALDLREGGEGVEFCKEFELA